MSSQAPEPDGRNLSPLVFGERGPEYDLLVIGGGCNGTGIARDAALRGLRVVLLEKDDLGVGATGNSSGMIHGGVKYLLSDRAVTRLSCLDSGRIQQIAPHLLFRIPFVVPVYRSQPFARPYLELAETFFAAYDRYQPLKNGLPHLRLSGAEVHAAIPGLAAAAVGGIVFDEWGIDAYRLVIANALAAFEAGAEILLGHRVEGLLQTATGRVYGVRERELATGRVRELTAAVVVNATGAWSPGLAGLAGQPLRLRPAKGIHLVYGRRLTNHALVARAIDGREIYLLPHGQATWIGTTDDDYFGDPDDVAVTADEIEYLLGGVAEVLPGILEYPILGTMVGIRPTVFRWGPYEDDLSRHHEILDHGLSGASGLISVIGGKLASYRLLAEETVDRVCFRLGRTAPCRTGRVPLPGGERQLAGDALATQLGLPQSVVQRLLQRHGDRVRQIFADRPLDRELVCPCQGVTAAEIRYVVRHEWARDLAMLRRRTGLGGGECGGARCLARAAQLLGMELGYGPRQVQELVQREQRRCWRQQRQVLGQAGVARLAKSRMLAAAARDLKEAP
ncbi:MAG: glycerol-3-phosphate dehydrogenase/oxidase [Myxococcota bacterium]|nr:glycerol-3-phosphate dehydrogenase/oxidase [Myxococcota bacterium]